MEQLILKLLLMIPWEKWIAQITWEKLKPILYVFAKTVVLPLLKKYVEDTESKWDDNLYKAVENIVEVILK